MASNPPFHVEDQTDEDFFDKLVEEEEDGVALGTLAKPVVHDQGNDDSDDAAKAFESLGIGDADAAFENSGVGNSGIELKKEENSGKLDEGVAGGNDREGGIVVSSSDSTVVDPGNRSARSEVAADSSAGKSNGIGSLEVKQVGWNAFNADSNNNVGFESYSDFFSEFGDQSGGNFPGKTYGRDSNREVKPDNAIQSDGLNSSVNYAQYQEGQGYDAYGGDSNSEVKPDGGIQNDGLNSSVNYTQYQEGQGYDTSVVDSTNGQDPSSSQDWENLYPGWRYDYNTGQWFQVEDYNATAATQGSSDADTAAGWTTASDAKTEVSYMQQTAAQSAAGTLAETGATESVSGWNQVLQGNNGYPEHMIFDPQYPDWYYDTIAQEWRSLETYNSSIQSAAQGLENGHASTGTFSQNDNSLYTEYGQAGSYGSQDIGSQAVDGSWGGSYGINHQRGLDTYTTEIANRSGDHVSSVANKQFDHSYGSSVSVNKDQQNTLNSFGSVPLYNNVNHNHLANGAFEVQSFAPSANFAQHFNYSSTKFDEHKNYSNDYTEGQKSFSYSQQSFQDGHHYSSSSSYAPHAGRSSAGRPPHALVTFGFGGKLVVMKDSSLLSSSYGSQDAVQGSLSVLNLLEVVTGSMDSSSIGNSTGDYFRALSQQSFPGPLVGGSVGSKELYKWIDERIAHCGSPDMDYKKGERLRLLLSLLKIACQHYGKLRSPFGTDTILKENDIPESEVAKLFASAKISGKEFTQYGVLSPCLQNLSSEGQIRATASEVQNLLVSGKKKEALQCAQEGQLWGPALVLASQLGNQYYVDTVKQLALRQLVAGSPLRTLCLLIAGQPAEVFSSDSSTSGNPSAFNMPNQPAQFGSNSMLDDWEENLAVITANRTKDDELVIIHLGDCLWKERSEITAAHICYLVAEANFESYSDTARLCLVGADHWKFPRTYASPEAIQRTELYEYSKVLGNSQFILLPFQPYKLIYAYMLAEVGKVSDSLKYCLAALKSLKTGRAPEVETWKQLLSSLEDRIRTHQQGGYAANLAPAKLVGKLLNFFDSTAHRVVGGLPPPAPLSSQGAVHGNDYHQPVAHRVSNSQSTMAMSSLVPSASMEPISDWTADSNRMTMANRSVSEPDFGRTPRQETTSPDAQGKEQVSGATSRFSRFGFGSQLLQKTVGLVLRPRAGNQAKLGEKNKFYYDEKLKRWVEEGAEPPAEETALPPPPTAAVFQNGSTEYNLKSALKTEGSPVNEGSDLRTSSPELTPGIPPIPPSTNQFSARSRMGVRSRYVDTFNQGGGSSTNLFQSPPVPSVKPALAANAKFFIPAPAPTSNQQTMADIAESNPEDSSAHENPSTSSRNDWSYQSPKPMSPVAMQRFPSMGNISDQPMSPVAMQRFPSAGNFSNQVAMTNGRDTRSPRSRRTASWGGSTDAPFSTTKMGETRPLGEALRMPPSAFMPNEFSSMSTPMKSGSFGDLHEVEL